MIISVSIFLPRGVLPPQMGATSSRRYHDYHTFFSYHGMRRASRHAFKHTPRWMKQLSDATLPRFLSRFGYLPEVSALPPLVEIDSRSIIPFTSFRATSSMRRAILIKRWFFVCQGRRFACPCRYDRFATRSCEMRNDVEPMRS